MSALTFIFQALAYDDLPPTSNPTQQRINRRNTIANAPVENAGTVPAPLDPGGTLTLFDESRTLGVDGSTAFDLTLSEVDSTVYRLTWTGAGGDPGFRTNRELDVTTIALTLELQTNLSLKVTAASGTPFADVASGDTVFIPGTSTGDPASPFNGLNEGYWTVLSSNGTTTITLARDPSAVFSGVSEVVTTANVSEFQAFASDGVQVGDTIDLSAEFAPAALRSFELTAVNWEWVEFRSTAPLGEEEDVTPGASGLNIYTSAKRFVLIETDQEIVVRFNADDSNNNRVEPILAGADGIPGSQHKFGTVWKLVLVNRSSVRANCVVSSAE